MSKITLADGRDVSLFRLYQRYTYEGVQAGQYTDERNNSLLEEAVAHARARPWLSAGAPVFLVPPKVRREQAKVAPNFMRQFERVTGSNASPPFYVPHLPAMLCIGCFFSDAIKSRPHELGSHLCVVWFQERFALPIDPAVEREIRELDWEALAAGVP